LNEKPRWCSLIELLTCNVWSALRVLCGPLRLCAEYWLFTKKHKILSQKAQSTEKHAEVIEQRRILTLRKPLVGDSGHLSGI
jgi:hypothetical protein